MRVILVQDIPRLGGAGEVREVADGYGRNYLLPRGLAEMASADALKRADEYRRAEARRQELLNEEMQGLANSLDGLEIIIKAKVGEQERLYGSVTSADVAEEAGRLSGQEVDKRKVELAEPIHQVGQYEVPVRLTRDLVPVLKVMVQDEDAEAKARARAEAEEKAEKKARAKKKAEEETVEVEETVEPPEALATVEETVEPAESVAAVEVEETVESPEAAVADEQAVESEEALATAEDAAESAEEPEAEAEDKPEETG